MAALGPLAPFLWVRVLPPRKCLCSPTPQGGGCAEAGLPGEPRECWEPGNGPWESRAAQPARPLPGMGGGHRDPSSPTGRCVLEALPAQRASCCGKTLPALCLPHTSPIVHPPLAAPGQWGLWLPGWGGDELTFFPKFKNSPRSPPSPSSSPRVSGAPQPRSPLLRGQVRRTGETASGQNGAASPHSISSPRPPPAPASGFLPHDVLLLPQPWLAPRQTHPGTVLPPPGPDGPYFWPAQGVPQTP